MAGSVVVGAGVVVAGTGVSVAVGAGVMVVGAGVSVTAGAGVVVTGTAVSVTVGVGVVVVGAGVVEPDPEKLDIGVNVASSFVPEPEVDLLPGT